MNVRSLAMAYGVLMLSISGCTTSTRDQGSLTEQQAIIAAWEALEPNTTSHDQANWQASAVRLVAGQEVSSHFDGEPAPGCLGPTPPPNGQISASRKYWYVSLQPAPATPRPWLGTPSPTAPPPIPEPFTRRAQFLLDVSNGTVVARQLACVIY